MPWETINATSLLLSTGEYVVVSILIDACLFDLTFFRKEATQKGCSALLAHPTKIKHFIAKLFVQPINP